MLIRIAGRENDEYTKRRLAAKETRRQEDIRSGLVKPKGATRGDFKVCRDMDKVIQDYCKFKDPRDRKKIKEEYFGRQQEIKQKRLEEE